MGFVRYAGGKPNMTKPLSGILASDIAVGSSVYLMENGSAVEYLVVNQGKPGGGSLYDDSCDGTWLLRKDIKENSQWSVWYQGAADSNKLENSAIYSYLDNTFFSLLGNIEQTIIKQIKIPYRKNGGEGGIDQSGINGLSCKVFLLSGREIGFPEGSDSYCPTDGEKLDYFDLSYDGELKRIATLNGTASIWWLRSPYNYDTTRVYSVSTTGSNMVQGSSNSYGIRPALILPFNALFDKNTFILKGVA